MSSIDRAVELLSVTAIVGVVVDAVRKKQEEAVAHLGADWVAENGPYLPMESLKSGMLSVHEEYQNLQREWRNLMQTLRSYKSDTEAVETAMVMLAAVAVRLALDIRAQAVRNGSYLLEDKEKKEAAPAEEILMAAID